MLMPMLTDVLGFSLKGLVVVVAILVVVGGIAALAGRRGREGSSRVSVRRLNRRYMDLANALRGPVLGAKRMRHFLKSEAHKRKAEAKGEGKKRVFVLEFQGDLAATAVGSLRHEISAILGVAAPEDEVVVKLESAGGVVHAYGLAASQLLRLRDKGIRLAVCVDKIAASGGYMMACIADELVAAPFAVVGSIGVVAPVPNIHELLKRHGVDFQEMTAGEFKRTVSLMGEISPAGRQKFQEQLEDTHALFKEFVAAHRPGLDIDKVATGEYWFGARARELKLVDRLQTSDDYLLGKLGEADVFAVTYKPPLAWRQKMAVAAADGLAYIGQRLLSRLYAARFG